MQRLRFPLVIAGLALLLSWFTFDSKLSLLGDDAELLTLARGMAQGSGYAYVNDPDLHVGSRLPVGFPALLVPIAWLDPTGWLLAKVFVMLWFAAAMALLWWFLDDALGRWWAAGICVVAMLAGHSSLNGGPLLLDYSHHVLTEIPFMALTLLALGLKVRRQCGWAIAVAVTAALVRSAGVALLLALLLSCLLTKSYRMAGWAAVGMAVALAVGALTSGGETYVDQLQGPQEALRRAWDGVLVYGGLLPASMAPLAALAILIPLGVWFWRLVPTVWLYVLFYLGMIVVWPWRGDRFLVPILPLLIALAVSPIAMLTRRKWYDRWVVAMMVAVVGGLSVDKVLEQRRAGQLPSPGAWGDYRTAAEWVRDHTPAESVIVTRKPFQFYLWSGRRSVCFPFDSTAAQFLGKADVVVYDGLPLPQTKRFLEPALFANKQRFKIGWVGSRSAVLVKRDSIGGGS